MTKVKVVLFGYTFTIFALFLYSYTQVDLGLTLSHLSFWRSIETTFQQLGYFNRPLSTYIYLMIISLLFVFYISLLVFVKKNKISRKTVWYTIILTAIVLTFSYNAFSYDLFNYIFDARIFTHYHLNPYQYKALDFPNDPMLSFMHWTHRVYPYGPFWLVLTVPLSFIGLQVFLATLFLFKSVISLSFITTAYFIEKILKKQGKADALFGLVFFAYNPLVIVEALVSSHLDIVMMFFFMLSLYVLLDKQRLNSLMFYLFSIGVKFATVFAAPFFLPLFLHKKENKGFIEKIFFLMAIFMAGSIVAESVRTNFQPWYLLEVLPLVALLAKKYYILIPSVIISFFSLLQYVFFLYNGSFNPPFASISFYLTLSSFIFSVLVTGLYKFKVKKT